VFKYLLPELYDGNYRDTYSIGPQREEERRKETNKENKTKETKV